VTRCSAVSKHSSSVTKAPVHRPSLAPVVNPSLRASGSVSQCACETRVGKQPTTVSYPIVFGLEGLPQFGVNSEECHNERYLAIKIPSLDRRRLAMGIFCQKLQRGTARAGEEPETALMSLRTNDGKKPMVLPRDETKQGTTAWNEEELRVERQVYANDIR
jgi:hypothetical protein